MSRPVRLALALVAASLSSSVAFASTRDAAPSPRPPSGVVWTLLPRAVTSFGAAVDGGWLYVLGGYHGTPHEYSREGQSRAFYRMSLCDPRDVELLPGEEGVQGAGLAAHHGRLLRVGGLAIENARGEPESLRSLDTVAFFDPRENAWTDGPALPEPRSSQRLAVAGDTAVVVGGWTLDGARSDVCWCDTWLALDLADPDARWTVHDAPFRRRALGLAATDTHVVAVGGMDGESGQVVSETWLLDLARGEWARGPDFPEAGFGAAACAADGRVFASARSGVVYALRPGDEAWSECAKLAFPRFFHELAATPDGELLALGGIVGMDPSGRLRHVERVRPAPAAAFVPAGGEDPSDATCDARDDAPVDDAAAAESTARVLLRLDVPTPALARNRQGAALVGRALYLFGGNRSTGQHDFGPDDFLSEGWRLSLADLSWERLPDFPARRQSMVALSSSDGRELRLFGGFGHDGDAARTQSGAQAFDLELGLWRALPELPAPLTQFGLADVGDAKYVLGGLDYDPDRVEDDGFRHVRTVLRADTAAREPRFVDTGLELPEARRAFGCAALDGRIYLVGGMAGDFARVEPCRAFDPAAGTFAEIASPRAVRISPELVALDGRLALFGGTSRDPRTGDSRSDPSIEVYDPATDTWRVALEDAGLDPRHARAFALDGRLLIVSFMASDAGVATIVLVDV
ncbi:MAG: hypothetical protein H6825_08930 [Planctomycetes bacterium]|nr:hypothetical protein [Planctomycetota bacterium]